MNTFKYHGIIHTSNDKRKTKNSRQRRSTSTKRTTPRNNKERTTRKEGTECKANTKRNGRSIRTSKARILQSQRRKTDSKERLESKLPFFKQFIDFRQPYYQQTYHCRKHRNNKHGFNLCYDCMTMFSLERKLNNLLSHAYDQEVKPSSLNSPLKGDSTQNNHKLRGMTK